MFKLSKTGSVIAVGVSVALFSLSPAFANGPNLVVNPGFETGDFTGYTQSGNLDFTDVSTGTYYAHSGTLGAALGPVHSDGILAQDIPTVAGSAYDVSFFLNSDGTTPNDFSASFDGTTFFNQIDIGSTGGFEEITYSGTASSNSTPLVFTFRNDPAFLALDDISVSSHDVTATPEPSTTASFGGAALGLGLLVLAAKRRKVFVVG